VIQGEDGDSDFFALHAALARRHAPEAQLEAFDLLRLDGADLRDRPIEERRARLFEDHLGLDLFPGRIGVALRRGHAIFRISNDEQMLPHRREAAPFPIEMAGESSPHAGERLHQKTGAQSALRPYHDTS
jgi:hypothetical protein